MPIPNPRFDETGEGGRQKYVSRCIKAIVDEYGEEQGLAICYAKWAEKNLAAIRKMRLKR
jgi:hypothetical protein